VELQGEWRCIHCNKVFEEEQRLERHGRTCEYKPPPRPRDSVVGRMATAAWEDGLQDVYPTITVTDQDTGKKVTLDRKAHARSLGSIFSTSYLSTKDMETKMAKADAEFWRGLHMWKTPYICRRSKMRMFRRYLQILIYAGQVCWYLTREVEKKLNNWVGAKMAAITGKSRKYENSKRRVNVYRLLRFFRLRLLGEILRSHDDDMRRGEVMMHAELVRIGQLPKIGSFVMDAPEYDSVAELEQHAGRVPNGSIEVVTIKASAARERQQLKWAELVNEQRPDDVTDSEDEEYEDVGAGDDEEEKKSGETDEEHKARMTALKEATEADIAAAVEQIRSTGARRCWVVHHDGGYTPPEDTKDKVARSGWGFRAMLKRLKQSCEHDEWMQTKPICSYGKVILDEEHPGGAYMGCVVESNNTAELSAVPHVMATMIDWRRQAAARRDEDRITVGEAVGLIMVYDSQYTKDHCTAPTHVPAPATNATVVKVCRRLVQATAERRFEIRWVKVKGHSGDEGNNAADVAAGWAQNGGTKGEKDIEGLMQRLRMDGGTDDDG
jgi:ribonuclease HI